MSRKFTIKAGALIVISLFVMTSARADLSQKQAREAIRKTVGMLLPSSAVKVTSVSSQNNTTAEASAQLELVFRVTRDEANLWRLRELRTGEARWDDVEVITRAANLERQPDACHTKADQRFRSEPNLTVALARCLVADFFNVSLPSDAVRIKNVSPLSFGSQPSALAVALVQTGFRLSRSTSGWQVVEMQTGKRGWVAVESVPSTIDSLKRSRTTEEMELIARALDEYRRDRGSYIVSDKHHVLVDHLNPRYLHRVARVDSWHRPFRYQGSHDHFTLRSLGADGKENTPDDIVVSK